MRNPATTGWQKARMMTGRIRLSGMGSAAGASDDRLGVAQNGVIPPLEPRVRTAAALDHFGGPREVLATPIQTPVGRRMMGDVTDVGDLVGDLDLLRPLRE